MDKAGETVQQSYERMRDALAATGRPILFSMCSWGHGQPWVWGQDVGNSWRTSADVFAVWDTEQAKRLKLPSFLIPVLNAAQSVADLAKYAGPGGFNDPDMLVRCAVTAVLSLPLCGRLCAEEQMAPQWCPSSAVDA